MKPTIRVILYDADGVINNALINFSTRLDQDYNLSLERTKDFFKGPFQKCLVGELDMREVLPEYLEKWGWQKSLDDFLEVWFKSEHSIEQAILDDVAALRQKGLKCYVATNNEKHRAQYMLEQMGFKDHFDGVFASAHLSSKKPEQAFFLKILAELQVRADEVLFWDDDIENIEGAQGLGIHAELFENVQRYQEVMSERYGLK